MTTHEIIVAMKNKTSRDNRKLYDEAVKKLELLESLPDKLVARRMTEQEIIAKLNGADVFLRDRADCIPAPLNEYDVLILKDIANTCNEAVALIERLQSKIARLKKYDEERDIKLHYRLTENAKHEAYKAFAEKIKSIDLNEFVETYYVNAEVQFEVRDDLFKDEVENILKEMREGVNDRTSAQKV